MKTQVWLEIKPHSLGEEEVGSPSVVATGLWPVHLCSTSELRTAHRAVATAANCILR